MKKKALRKDFFMELKKSRNRFCSILFIVALGSAFFSGIQSAAPDMRLTGDHYFDENKLMDLRVLSTLGITQEDLAAMEALPQIQLAEGGYSEDVIYSGEENQAVLRVESYSDQVNLLTAEEGSLPQKPGDCFLDAAFVQKYGYKVGDRLQFHTEEDSMLKRKWYTVCGYGSSPMYISFERGSSALGNGEIAGFVSVLPEEFDSDVYTAAYLLAKDSQKLCAYTEEYDAYVAELMEQLKAIGPERCEIRYREVKEEANQKLTEGKEKIADGEKEAADARQELADAREKTQKELADARAELEDGQKELENGKKELEDAREEYQSGLKEVQDAKEEIRQKEAELEDGRQKLQNAKAELQEGEKQWLEGKRQYDSEAEAANKKLQDAEAEIEQGNQKLEEGKIQIQNGKTQLEQGKNQLSEGREQLETGKKESNQAREELDQGWKEYEEGAKKLEQGKQQYENGRKQYEEAEKQYQQEGQKLEEGKTQWEAGKQQWQEADGQMQAAKEQLDEARAQLEQEQEKISGEKEKLAEGKAALEQGKQEYEAAKQQLETQKKEWKTASAALEKQLSGEEETASGAQQQLDAGNAAIRQAEDQVSQIKAQLEQKQQEIDGADAKLQQAEQQIKDGSDGLEQKQKAWNEGYQELEQKKKQLDESEKQLEKGLEKWKAAGKQLEQTKQQLQESEEELNQRQQQLEAAKEQLQNAETQLEAGKQQQKMGEEYLQEQSQKYEEGKQEIEQQEQRLNDSETQLEAAREETALGYEKLREGEQQLALTRQQLDEGKKQWEASHAQLTEGQEQLAQGKEELNKAEAELTEAEKKIQDGEAEIAENEKKLQDGWKDYEEGKKEAQEKIQDAENQIADAEKELEDAREELEDAQKKVDEIAYPKWYVQNRTDLPENEGLGENAMRMSNIGKVFPVLFFLVAALISLTTMTRMVEEERTQIGTLKALGYGKWDIVSKYLRYAFWATALGSISGILAGEKILPWIVVNAYGIMYQHIHTILIPYQFCYAVIAVGASLFCTIGATVCACSKELRAVPAALMRPPAPKAGKRVLLEKIRFFWNPLSFSWKSTIRNLLRYKKRFLMTVFGIGGCMGLLLVGYGIRDSIVDVAVLQFENLQHYEAMMILDPDLSEQKKQKIFETVQNQEEIKTAAFCYMQKKQAEADTGEEHQRKYSAYLVVLEGRETEEFFTFQDRQKKTPQSLTDKGAIVTEKLAEELGLKAGDSLAVEEEDGTKISIPIASVCENYLSNYIYMTAEGMKKITSEQTQYNTVLLKTNTREEEKVRKTGTELLKLDGVLNVTYTITLAERIEHMLGALDLVIVVLIVSAGMLAFVVLYNLNNININERRRELATLKVLGFYDREVAMYVYRENVILTVLGAALGCVIGKFLHGYIIRTVEIENCMFGRSIKPLSFLYAVLFTVGFSILVNAVMYFRLKKINMVESLKSTE